VSLADMGMPLTDEEFDVINASYPHKVDTQTNNLTTTSTHSQIKCYKQFCV